MTVATAAVVAVAYRTGAQPRTVAEPFVSQPTVHPTGSRHPSRPAPRTTSTVRPTPRPLTTTPTPPTSSSALVVAGGVVDTPYGPVQVEITVRAGQITKVRALERPSGDGRTDQINGYAIPQLDHEAVAAQNAHLDTVSGATFTSEGYTQSLQSAIDAAHRAGAG
jgi:uncharacterized protein with FMN-binding domain